MECLPQSRNSDERPLQSEHQHSDEGVHRHSDEGLHLLPLAICVVVTVLSGALLWLLKWADCALRQKILKESTDVLIILGILISKFFEQHLSILLTTCWVALGKGDNKLKKFILLFSPWGSVLSLGPCVGKIGFLGFVAVALWGAFLTASSPFFVQHYSTVSGFNRTSGVAMGVGGCNDKTCNFTSVDIFPAIIKGTSGITTTTYAADSGSYGVMPMWPNTHKLNPDPHSTRVDVLRNVRAAEYTYRCLVETRPDNRFYQNPILFNGTDALEARSSTTLTSDGSLLVYLGLLFRLNNQFQYFPCDITLRKVDVDATWRSRGNVLGLVNVTNITVSTNSSWVQEVQEPLTRLSLVFENTLTYFLIGDFLKASDSKEQHNLVLKIASAFAQTTIMRAAQGLDDLYVQLPDRIIDVTWYLDNVAPADEFVLLVECLVALGSLSVLSAIIVCLWRKGDWTSPTFDNVEQPKVESKALQVASSLSSVVNA